MIHGMTLICIRSRNSVEESNKLYRGSANELHRRGDGYSGFEAQIRAILIYSAE